MTAADRQGDRLTEAEKQLLGLGLRTPYGLYPAVEQILRDRARPADEGCHPYDERCGGPGGPCRNHGGAVRPADEDGLRAAIETLADTLTTFCDVRKHQVFDDKGEDDYNRGIRRAVDDLRAVLAAHPEPTTTKADEWRCKRCNSPRWVAASLNGGTTVIKQCVPCGRYSGDRVEACE